MLEIGRVLSAFRCVWNEKEEAKIDLIENDGFYIRNFNNTAKISKFDAYERSQTFFCRGTGEGAGQKHTICQKNNLWSKY